MRDSYREARNGWVLQVMLGLALLLVLFVASVSFRPTTVQDELDTALGFMTKLVHSNPQFRTLDIRTEEPTSFPTRPSRGRPITSSTMWCRPPLPTS